MMDARNNPNKMARFIVLHSLVLMTAVSRFHDFIQPGCLGKTILVPRMPGMPSPFRRDGLTGP
jgi:hypothetical protein